ncbi:hypothetical protein BDP27DRAFT_1440941 [Rhodocollybia butyracea]|uniref:Uncharacterized protein n=1 Tax=Rhodocollybia butyracea TaxID=206335 RepID=A0A9P5QAL2_9AGAR|nr:hypothetical protein BDP27DRAFT_1440941 [Rhodocollybia butyracea]
MRTNTLAANSPLRSPVSQCRHGYRIRRLRWSIGSASTPSAPLPLRQPRAPLLSPRCFAPQCIVITADSPSIKIPGIGDDFPVIGRITLDRHIRLIDKKFTGMARENSKGNSSSSPSTAFTGGSQGRANYLSRSQRRLASTVLNPSHDVHQYIYQGGQTSVVSGGVMLGPKPPATPTTIPGQRQVQGKRQGQGQNQQQHQMSKNQPPGKSKQAQGSTTKGRTPTA